MSFLKKIMGMGGAKSDSKKEEIRSLFNSKVENGDEYATIAAMNLVTTKKLLKEIRTYYNYIIGYKDGDDPEMVIISTTNDLSSLEEPVLCKKSECVKADYLSETGSFSVTHPQFGSDPVNFSIIVSTAWDGYIIDVSYLDEYTPFTEFFQNRFAK